MENNLPAYTPIVKEKKPLYTLDARDWIAAGVLLALSFVAVIAGLWSGFNIGWAAAFDALFLAFSLYLCRRGARIGAFPLLCGILAVLLSGVFLTTSDGAVHAFSIPGMACLAVVWFSSLGGHTIPGGELGVAACVIERVGLGIAHTPHSIRSLFSAEDPRVKTLSKVLIGLLCAVPVLCAVIPLLIRSDAAFEGMMAHLFSDFASTAAQTVLSLILFAFLLGFAFSARKDADQPKKMRAKKSVETVVTTAFLSVLSLCYLAYLFSQLAYFFSAFAGLMPQDYTHSVADYARRGFFELCWIAGINLAVLYLMLLFAKKKNGKLPVILRILGTFIVLFTLLIIGTAISKMVLYMRAFGATTLRIGTSSFMLFMAVVFLALLLRFYIAKVRVLPVAAVTAAVVLLVLGIGNLPGFVARYNYTAYETGKLATVDTAYMRRLADAGIPYLIRLTEAENKDVRQSACGDLAYAIEHYYTGTMTDEVTKESGDTIVVVQESFFIPDGKIHAKLSEFTLPRKAAYDALDAFLKANPDFLRNYAEERTAAMENDWEMF